MLDALAAQPEPGGIQRGGQDPLLPAEAHRPHSAKTSVASCTLAFNFS
jgi:hypothetical protein